LQPGGDQWFTVAARADHAKISRRRFDFSKKEFFGWKMNSSAGEIYSLAAWLRTCPFPA
jgi:hypothetical protein